MKRIIVGISGASGVILGYRLLEALKQCGEYHTHLIITENAYKNFQIETNIDIQKLSTVADYYHDNHDMTASISSGSYVTDGMIIAPCSMKTLSAVVNGYASELIIRAADVCLKENRKVILVPREMPLGKIHLRNMLTASDLGCTIIPPMLTFYNHPSGLEEQINHIIGKIFLQLGLNYRDFHGWHENDE